LAYLSLQPLAPQVPRPCLGLFCMRLATALDRASSTGLAPLLHLHEAQHSSACLTRFSATLLGGSAHTHLANTYFILRDRNDFVQELRRTIFSDRALPKRPAIAGILASVAVFVCSFGGLGQEPPLQRYLKHSTEWVSRDDRKGRLLLFCYLRVVQLNQTNE
jgi:hypothetical protein